MGNNGKPPFKPKVSAHTLLLSMIPVKVPKNCPYGITPFYNNAWFMFLCFLFEAILKEIS